MKKQIKQKEVKVTRFKPDPKNGLTQAQIDERIKDNLLNVSSVKTSKSIGSILFKNIFTFFNIICLVVAVALIFVGAYTDLAFWKC